MKKAPMTQLADAKNNFLKDFLGDDGSTSLLSDSDAAALLARALSVINADIPAPYAILSSEVSPAMPASHRELWLCAAAVLMCRRMGSQAAQRFKFQSGDKSVDRTTEANNWKWLRESYEATYKTLLNRINPSATNEDVITPGLRPVIYEQHAIKGHEYIDENGNLS